MSATRPDTPRPDIPRLGIPRPGIPRLGVNIDHVATVRNARGGVHPDPLDAALAAVAAGADGITLHLREDRRHIRDADVAAICRGLSVPVNLEMASTDEMVAVALQHRPHAACIVPERRQEVTTEGGLDAAEQFETLAPRIAALRGAGIRVSLFIDADSRQIEAAARLGVPVVELHTGAYAENRPGELERLRQGAALAAALDLEVHAGHGLTYANVSAVAAIPVVAELNIGHYLIGQAILDGLPGVVARMKALVAAAR